MTDPTAARSFLLGEVEALEPFEYVGVVPSGRRLHVVETTRREDGTLEVRVPGRPKSVPTLASEVRSALAERGFAAEDPTDPKNPWLRDAEDGNAAVDLMQQLLIEVFGEKSDVALDIGHGSHKAEHETRQKLALARTRIESIVADLLERDPEQDKDGDYVLPIDEVHVMIAPRAAPDGQIVVRVFVITNVGVNVTPDLGLLLARLNFGQMFGRFALDTEHSSIWFDETLLGEEFREEELRFAIRMVASTADEWDDRFKQMFGGNTYQEVLAGHSSESAPTTKPGEGIGMYL
jgi:hypothetical protein